MYTKNMNKFYFGKNNICFITGLSGSGKSSEALLIKSKYPSVYTIIHLDNFEQCYEYKTLEEVRTKAGEVFYKYFCEHPDVYNQLIHKTLSGKALQDEISSFLEYAVQYCKANKKEKYLIEGVQIYCFLDVEKYKDMSFKILDDSLPICMGRKIKRTISMDGIKSISDMELRHMFLYYLDEQRALKRFMERLKNPENSQK